MLEAGNGRELLQLLPTTPLVQIVLLDVQMPEMDGFETCRQVKRKYPDIKVLALTQLDDADTIDKMLELGVDGYFTKNTDPSELQVALQQLADGAFHFEERLTVVIDRIFQKARKRQPKPASNVVFTSREIEIMHLTLQGGSEVNIGEALSISRKTVEKHKRNLMEKTEAQNFIGVITFALLNGLLTLKDLKKLQAE